MSYEDQVLQLTPTAYWRLDETSGSTATDASGNGHDATYGGDPTLGEPPLINAGNSVAFDGVDDGIEAGDTPFDFGTSSFTIAAWINLDSIGPFHTVAHHRDVGGTYAGYIFGVRGSGKLGAYAGDGDSSNEAISSTEFSAGEVRFVVARFDRGGNAIDLFIDGAKDGSADLSAVGDIGCTDNLRLARSGHEGSTSWGYLEGHVDEIAIFGAALTDSEIQDLYTQGIAGSYSVTGTVTADGSAFEATVRAYRWNDGELLSETVSDSSDGSYTIQNLTTSADVMVVIKPPSGYRPLAHGPITPMEQ